MTTTETKTIIAAQSAISAFPASHVRNGFILDTPAIPRRIPASSMSSGRTSRIPASADDASVYDAIGTTRV